MRNMGLEKIIERERRRLSVLQREYRAIRGGNLHIRYRDGRYFFWEYNNKSQKGITKNKKLVYQLARKKYLEREISLLEKRVEIITKASEALVQAAVKANLAYVEEYNKILDIDRIVYSKTELEWIKNKNSANPYLRENLKYRTKQGVMVRSKSERLIGNVLEEKGLPYVVEPEILIDGKSYYPDFMVLRADGTTVIWEHCGLMEDGEYVQRALMKINKYRRIGYVQTDNLIYTFEEDLENMDRIDEIIDRFIMM